MAVAFIGTEFLDVVRADVRDWAILCKCYRSN